MRAAAGVWAAAGVARDTALMVSCEKESKTRVAKDSL